MSVASSDTAIRSSNVTRTFIYLFLLLFALFYLMPLGIMLVNSLKPLSEITGGINYRTIQFLRTTSNLSPIQVSALRYYNRLEDPAKYQDVLPGGGIMDAMGPQMGLS